MAKLQNRQQGFSLVEMLAAIALLCIGLLTLFNCFTRSVILDGSAAERAEAVRIAQEQIEMVKAMNFADVGFKSEQLERNGLLYTCQVSASERQYNSRLKDVSVIVSWMPPHSIGEIAGQVQFNTAILRR